MRNAKNFYIPKIIPVSGVKISAMKNAILNGGTVNTRKTTSLFLLFDKFPRFLGEFLLKSYPHNMYVFSMKYAIFDVDCSLSAGCVECHIKCVAAE